MEQINGVISIKLPDFGVLAQSRIVRPGFAHATHCHDYDSFLFVMDGQGIRDQRVSRLDRIGQTGHKLVPLSSLQLLFDNPFFVPDLRLNNNR